MRFRDDLELRRRVAEEAARAAGAIHLEFRGRKLERDVHAGERADYTTEVDLAAQQAVRDAVARRFPHERVIGEEDKDGFVDIERILDAGCWLTDPLDGTLEYVHGASGYSCVVSYVEGGRPLAAAVYFAAWDELFSAAEGMGATLNGAPIHVSGQRDLSAALFATPHRSTKPEDAQPIRRR